MKVDLTKCKEVERIVLKAGTDHCKGGQSVKCANPSGPDGYCDKCRRRKLCY